MSALPAISPFLLLLAVVLATVIPLTLGRWTRRRRQRALLSLARAWRMHYSAEDVFHLAPRIAGRLGVPGAAAVVVQDLIYGNAGDGHRYIFRAEFSLGATRHKRRAYRIASMLEVRSGGEPRIDIASEGVPWLEQYRALNSAATDQVTAN